jgi:8-oxo-dGTP pyrophosphatase MutT (NUDIX family)
MFLRRITVKAYIRQNKAILLTCDKDRADQWELPGGRIEKYEQPLETLRRELREELGLKITGADLVDALIWHSERGPVGDEANTRLSLIYQVYIGKQALLVGGEVKNARWFTVNELRKIKIQANSRRFIEERVLTEVRGAKHL